MVSDDVLDRPAARVRVLLVDDHEVLTAGLEAVLSAEPDLEVVGTCTRLDDALAQARRLEPDVALLDHHLPDAEGVPNIRRLHEASPGTRVVVLTGGDPASLLVEAMRQGAVGFLSKTRSLADVAVAIRAAAAGDAVLTEDLMGELIAGLEARSAPASGIVLTGREQEILDLLAEGLTNPAIARRLYLSPHTVRNHVTRLLGKLGAHSKLEGLVIATREGLVSR